MTWKRSGAGQYDAEGWRVHKLYSGDWQLLEWRDGRYHFCGNFATLQEAKAEAER